MRERAGKLDKTWDAEVVARYLTSALYKFYADEEGWVWMLHNPEDGGRAMDRLIEAQYFIAGINFARNNAHLVLPPEKAQEILENPTN